MCLLLPISVYAGLTDVINNVIFRVSAEQISLNNKNLQNMALLTATNAPLGNKTVEIAIQDDALVPNTGPSGGDFSLVGKSTSDQISTYVVREGDTISQIAEMFNVTVNTIKWGNDLSSNTLKVGDTLVILPISGVRHVVSKGDTLASIAKKYNGDKDEIIAYNNLNKEESLTAGSIIIIPDGEVSVHNQSGSVSKPSIISGLKEFVGYYLRPIVGGRRSQGLHGHNGVDIAAPIGTPILASADGEVIISKTGGWNGGYGSYIVIKHKNGTQTLYSHNSQNIVSVGDFVKQGDVIGYVGTTGKVTGPHLHFEIRGAKNPF